MWLKVLNVLAQIIIIILALVVVFTMSKKQMIDSTFSSFQKRIDEQLAEDRKHYDERIGMVQDNLNRYQLNREQRAKFLTTRIDELYDLYKKDPSPILKSNNPPLETSSQAQPEIPVFLDKNFTYVETRLNKIDERLDINYNKLEGRLNILEQRVNLLNSNKASGVKVIQNNMNNQTITGTVQ